MDPKDLRGNTKGQEVRSNAKGVRGLADFVHICAGAKLGLTYISSNVFFCLPGIHMHRRGSKATFGAILELL